MVLGLLKKTKKEETWSVILNPLRDDIQKRSAAQKIQIFFSVSQSEAKDLIANTPIILIDKLDQETAGKIREVFLHAGLEVVLTNEPLVKRKCFRAVWPQEPSAQQILKQGSLRGSSLLQKSNKSKAAQDEVSSLNRSFSSDPSTPSQQQQPQVQKGFPKRSNFTPNTSKIESLKQPEKQVNQTNNNNELLRKNKAELDDLRKKEQDLRKENKDVSNELDKAKITLNQAQDKASKIDAEKKKVQDLLLDSQKENEELRKTKKEAEKLEKQLSDYRSQREQFEGTKIEYELFVRELQEEKNKLEFRVRNMNKDLAQKEKQIQDISSQASQSSEDSQSIRKQLTEKTEELNSQKDVARRLELELQNTKKQTDENNQQAQFSIKNINKSLANQEQQNEQLTRKNQELQNSLNALNDEAQNEKVEFTKSLKDRENQVQEFSAKCDGLTQEKEVGEKTFLGQLKAKDILITDQNRKLEQFEAFKKDVEAQCSSLESELNILKSQISEKTSLIQQQSEKINQGNISYQDLHGRYKKIEEELESKRVQYDETKKELEFTAERYDVEKKSWDKRSIETTEEITQLRAALEKKSGDFERLSQNFNELKVKASQEEERANQSSQRWEKDLKEWSELREFLEEKVTFLTKELSVATENLNRTTNESRLQKEKIESLNSQYSQKATVAESLERQLSETKNILSQLKLDFDTQTTEYTQTQDRLQRSQASFEQACNKISALEAENEDLKRLNADLGEQAKRIPEIEAVSKRFESQFEVAQRQIKEIYLQKEQQEIVDKRLKLQNDLKSKEDKLKDLVKKQSGLEQELFTRQEAIKEILDTQEQIEKDMIKGKQALKYIIEMTKLKEKTRTTKVSSAQEQPIVEEVDEVEEEPMQDNFINKEVSSPQE